MVLSKFLIGHFFGMAIALVKIVISWPVAVERDEDYVGNCLIGSVDPNGTG